MSNNPSTPAMLTNSDKLAGHLRRIRASGISHVIDEFTDFGFNARFSVMASGFFIPAPTCLVANFGLVAPPQLQPMKVTWRRT